MKTTTEPKGRESAEVKPFLDHLEDLRHALLRCLAALAAGMLIALPLTRRILALLMLPLARVVPDTHNFLQSIEITEAFTVIMRTAFWGGIVISAPVVFFFAAEFIFPGLTRGERRMVHKASIIGTLLFCLGALIGYEMMLPAALHAMLRLHHWIGVRPIPRISSYVAFSTHLIIAFGLAFELPVVILALGSMGLVTDTQLRTWRRHVIVGLLIIAMLLTPPDVFTQLLLATPLILLYEACIWVLWFMRRARRHS